MTGGVQHLIDKLLSRISFIGKYNTCKNLDKGTDLNSVTDIGWYTSGSAAEVAMLVNRPSDCKEAINIWVIPCAGATYQREQVITESDAETSIYVRCLRNLGTGEFDPKPWMKIQMAQVETISPEI